MEPGLIAGLTILGVFALAWAGSFVLAGPIGKAVAQRIAGKGSDEALSADLDACLVELEALRSRVLELEERVDFAERLLPSPGGAAPRADLHARSE
jgi:hypothetical protein